MDWKDVGTKIIDLLPMAGSLASPFIGPAGPLLGTAIKAIAGVFGLKSADPKPEEIMAAINADPNAALKMQTAKIAFETEKMKLEFEERENIRNTELEQLRIQLNDVQSARSREVEITKTTGRRDMLQFWLAVFGWLAPVGLVAYLIGYGLPKGIGADVAVMIGGFLGIIISQYGTIYQYFFGSSKGSEAKTELLAKQNNH